MQAEEGEGGGGEGEGWGGRTRRGREIGQEFREEENLTGEAQQNPPGCVSSTSTWLMQKEHQRKLSNAAE